MQKIKEGEITCDMYLDLADGLRTNEECYLLNQMNLSREYLDVVEQHPVTLAPPSTYQISENQMIR